MNQSNVIEMPDIAKRKSALSDQHPQSIINKILDQELSDQDLKSYGINFQSNNYVTINKIYLDRESSSKYLKSIENPLLVQDAERDEEEMVRALTNQLRELNAEIKSLTIAVRSTLAKIDEMECQ